MLIADGGDSCDADICATAASLKQKAKGLRIDVIGIDDKAASLKPLACVAAVTGGTFVAATSQSELKQGLATVLDAASGAGETNRQRLARLPSRRPRAAEATMPRRNPPLRPVPARPPRRACVPSPFPRR